MKNLKNNKGVTLIILVLTILVLLILSGVTFYNSTSQLNVKKINQLYNDIDNIGAKVSSYYLQNNELPIIDNVIEKNYFESMITESEENKINKNDGDNYYVIDLSKLNNLTLNYGSEYTDIKNELAKDEASDIVDICKKTYKDTYIINSMTHQIYYLKGIKLNGVMYYTKLDDADVTAIKDETVKSINSNMLPTYWSSELTGSIFKEINFETESITDSLVEINYTIKLDSTATYDSLQYAYVEVDSSIDTTDNKVVAEFLPDNSKFTKFEVSEKNHTTTIKSKTMSTGNKYILYVRALKEVESTQVMETVYTIYEIVYDI